MDVAAERLDLGAIRASLHQRVHTPLGEVEVERLEPLPFSAACERIEAVSQARALLELREPPPVSGAHDVRVALGLAEKDMVLEGAALRMVAETIRAGSAVRAHLTLRESKAPLLYGLAAGFPDLGRLAGDILRCFDSDGQLADHASPELGPIRQRVRGLRERIQDRIAEMLRSPEIEALLQDRYYTLRGERYVLPVKASSKNELQGIVHDASGSGQTVFIEPQVLVDLGNRLKIAQSEQAEEELRILSRLTGLVAREAGSLRTMCDALGAIDFLVAAARLSEDLEATPVRPEPEPCVHLLRARHPLLLLQAAGSPPEGTRAPRVVANDLALKPGQQVLVLTGPNTGGKTVAMKTVGLFALMVRCGLHLPCGPGSRMGWFERIEVAIGDQQSIASNLSTFAAHMLAVIDILGRSDARTLVLIDEIGADTDPVQGQALAQAILERLAELGARVVVTTHYERLKAVPFVDPRFRNAGAGFDAVRMCPTYRLTLDVPKSSSGLEIAASLGLPPSVAERARSLAGDEASSQIDALLRGLERRGAELDQAREQAEESARKSEAEAERLRLREQALAKEIESLEQRAHEALFREVEEARERVRGMIARLQAAEATVARETMREANDVAAELAAIKKDSEAKLAQVSAPGPALETVLVGDRVHVASLGRDAEVVEVAGKYVHVAVGTMRMRVPLSDVRPAKSDKSDRPRRPERPRSASGTRKPEATSEPATLTEDFDLRGFGVDEALARLDAFLDHHYDSATTHVRIVHGLGTGVLRDAIREHLRRSGYVRSCRPGDLNEGGDGATVAALA